MARPNLSIRTKLTAGFGLALALIVVVGIIGVVQLRAFNDFASDLTRVWMPEIELLGGISVRMAQHQILAGRRLETTGFRQLADIVDQMDAHGAEIRTDIGSLAGLVGDGAEREAHDKVQSGWETYERSLEAIWRLMETGEFGTALDLFEAEAVPSLALAQDQIDWLLEVSKQQGVEAVELAHVLYTTFEAITVGAIILAILIVGVAVAWIGRNITGPIQRVSQAMEGLTAGDATTLITDDRDRHDEIGALIAAFAGYRESLARGEMLAAEAEVERQRLFAAIHNMPIGLSMFDAEKRLIVCNSRYAEMYALPRRLTEPGTPLDLILKSRVKSGKYAGKSPGQYLLELTGKVNRMLPFRDIVQFHDGRIYSLTFQPMESGGWVSTHEDVTDRRKAEEQIIYLGLHDALTDLPNRVHFSERIGQAISQSDGNALAVLYLDLDRFKAVNDTLGHPVGDVLLQTVATRLRRTLRSDEFAARLGGDEFAVLQADSGQPVGATALAERIIETLNAPYVIEGRDVVIGVSIGIAVARSDGVSGASLLKQADMALYRAKSDGRGIYRFFEQEMDDLMQERRLLELDLRKALVLGQYELHYQPLLDLEANRITSFEALIRWRHPTRGVVPPVQFIPLAEEIGLIEAIGEWVVHQACADAAQWPRDIRVAVNLSPIQLKGRRILTTLAEALAKSGLAADRLEIEITEGVLMVDTAHTLEILHQIRAMGIRISMDDFGTGYSSLSYLRRFPFDKIKIDGSFVHGDAEDDKNAIAIIRAVTGLSQSLGVTTTAEGVETEQQLELVRSEGCSEAQGFLISRPLPAADVHTLLSTLDTRGISAA